jgi:hypothetical protein
MSTDQDQDLGGPIDFSQVEGLKPIEPQRIAFNIESADAGVSQSGYGKVTCKLRIEEPEGVKGRVVFDTFSFHPNALPFTKEKLMALGLGDFSGDPQGLAEELLGESGVAAVGIDQNAENINPDTQEPYGPRNSVKKYFPAGTPLVHGGVSALD